MGRKLIDFEVEQKNPVEYELRLGFPLDNRMFKLAFDGAKRAMSLKKGVEVKGDVGKVDEFDVPDRFFKVLNVACTGTVKDLNKREFASDGFRVVTHEVVRAKFKRFEGRWKCLVWLEGKCIEGGFKG